MTNQQLEQLLNQLLEKKKNLLTEIKKLEKKYEEATLTSVEYPIETFQWSFIPCNFESTFIKWEHKILVNDHKALLENIRELKRKLKEKGKKRKRSIDLESDTEYDSDENDFHPKGCGILGFIPNLEGKSLMK